LVQITDYHRQLIPYKIFEITVFTDTFTNLDSKMDTSKYDFFRHEDVLSDDADFDLIMITENYDTDIYYELEVDRNAVGEYRAKIEASQGLCNAKSIIRIEFQDQATANLAKVINIRWNIEKTDFEPKLSKFPFVMEVVEARYTGPQMSTDVFSVPKEFDGGWRPEDLNS